MRKMANKKGFSLVELMIVVVIMGILVAVAIPLYGAITDSSRAKTCRSNQKLIHEAFAQWVLGGDENERNAATLFKVGTSYNAKTTDETAGLPTTYLELFSDNKLPHCPDSDHYYVIEYVRDTEIKVTCHQADGSIEDAHKL